MISKSWKRWVWSFSLAIHVSHPKKSTSIFFCCPKSLLPYPIFLATSDQKAQPSFPTPFSLFLFSSFFALTRQPSLSHQNKISLSKEEIKGLTLKFQLPSLWVTRTRTRTLELLLYNLSRLLFSGKGFTTCAIDKYKDYFEKYYALILLIRDIMYKHD